MEKMCPQCGAPVPADAKKCEYCGAAIEQSAQQPQPNQQTTANNGTPGNGQYLNGQNKWVIAIVAFLLGGLGIHNFMMGEAKKGIARIVLSLCCGIGYIFALIDMIMVLCGTYVVNPNKLFF